MGANAPEVTTHASLLVRIRDPGDGVAWDRFAGVYGPFIFGMCRRAGLNETEAADATQNVFVRVLKSIRSFEYRPEAGRFRGWLHTLTRNAVADLRGQAARSARAGADRGPRPAAQACWEDGAWEEAFGAYVLHVALERVRRRTSKRQWVIFKLTWLVECPAERVAARFGLPVARVFEAKCRTLRRLREEVSLLAEEAAAVVPARGPRAGARREG